MGSLGAVVWLAEAGVWLALAAGAAVRSAGPGETRALLALRTLWYLCLGVGLAGTALGYLRLLHPGGWLAATALAGLAAWRGLRGAGLGARWAALRSGWEAPERDPWLAAALAPAALALVGAGWSALATVPVSTDDLMYRLPRLGVFLQEGSLWHFPTFDDRHNTTGAWTEALAAWPLSHWGDGWLLASWPSAAAGLMVLLGVWAAARRLGAPLRAAGLAVSAVAVAPLFVAQTHGLQTDVVVAAAVFTAWVLGSSPGAAWGRGLALAGAGVAVAAKATALLSWPGLALAFLAARGPRPEGGWARALVVALAVGAVAAAPRLWQNQHHYGHPLVSRAWAEAVRVRAEPSALVAKLWDDAVAVAAQSLAPATAPGPLQPAAGALSAWVASLRWLPGDAHTMAWADRQRDLAEVAGARELSADDVPPGWLLPVLALAGLAPAWARRREPAGRVLGAALAGVLALHAGLALSSNWQPHSVRFYAAALPWLALPAALALGWAAARRWVVAGLAAVLAAGWVQALAAAADYGPRPPVATTDATARFDAYAALAARLPAAGGLALLAGEPCGGLFRQPGGPRLQLTDLRVVQAASGPAELVSFTGWYWVLCLEPLPADGRWPAPQILQFTAGGHSPTLYLYPLRPPAP